MKRNRSLVKKSCSALLLAIIVLAFIDVRTGTSEKWIDNMKEKKTARARIEAGGKIEIKDGVFSPEVMLAMGRISDPQVSPDGSMVIYGTGYISVEENNSLTNLYICGTDGSGAYRLTTEGKSISNARWSADGKSLAFIQEGQIFTAKLKKGRDGRLSLGKKVQVSDVPAGISQFTLSDDQSRIMYVSTVQSALKKPSDLYGDLDKADAISADDLMYRHWDHWVKEVPHTFVAGFVFGKEGEKSITPGTSKDILASEKEIYELPTEPFSGIEQLAWSPDGKTIAYSCRKLTGKKYAFSTNTEIYFYDVESGECTQLTMGGGYDTNPVWSPDGKKICWISMERDGYEADKQRLMVADIEWGVPAKDSGSSASRLPVISGVKDITCAFKYNASAPVWGTGSDEIYFSALAEGIQGIFRARCTVPDGQADGGVPGQGAENSSWDIERITGEDLWYDFNSPFHISENDGVTTLLADYSSMDFPTELVSIRIGDKAGTPDGGTIAAAPLEVSHSTPLPAECKVTPEPVHICQITHVNDAILAQLDPVKTEARYIKTVDGKDMLTWVVYPPHFDSSKEYPSILICLGGPQGTLSQGWSYRWNYRLMAAQGYVTVLPNRRGTTAFGQEWTEQISGDYPGLNMQDYLVAARTLKAEPYIGKMAACGASYGGYSVYNLCGIHGDVFDAFVAHAGIFNEEHMYMTTEEMWFPNWDNGGLHEYRADPRTGTPDGPVGPAGDGETFGGIRQGGSPWSTAPKAVRHYRMSPHTMVTKWHTPILVTHGGMDFRVPLDEGMAAYNTAQLMGVPSRLIVFPDENHWILRPQNALYWHREYFRWLDRWLKTGDLSRLSPEGALRLNAFIKTENDPEQIIGTARELTYASRGDKGCISYDIFRSLTDRNSMMICETWADGESLELHKKAPHFTSLVPELKASAEMHTDSFTIPSGTGSPDNGTPVRVNQFFRTAAQGDNSIVNEVRDMAGKATGSEGCISFDIFRSATDAGLYLLCSTWKDMESCRAFTGSIGTEGILARALAADSTARIFPMKDDN